MKDDPSGAVEIANLEIWLDGSSLKILLQDLIAQADFETAEYLHWNVPCLLGPTYYVVFMIIFEVACELLYV